VQSSKVLPAKPVVLREVGSPTVCSLEQYNAFMQYSQILPEDDDDELTSTRSRRGGAGQSRRPIVFTFNSNGST